MKDLTAKTKTTRKGVSQRLQAKPMPKRPGRR